MKLRTAKLRGIKRNSSVAEYPPPLASGELRKDYSPRLAYSAEAAASAAKAGHPRSKLRGIRRRRINPKSQTLPIRKANRGSSIPQSGIGTNSKHVLNFEFGISRRGFTPLPGSHGRKPVEEWPSGAKRFVGGHGRKAVVTGFTLIEALVTIAIFTIIAVGVYASYIKATEVVAHARARVAASAIANDDIELIRILPSTAVGIAGGFPSGVLERVFTASRANHTFTVTRTIRNIDDAFDGTIGGTPNDTAPADYKLVEIEVTCTSCRGALSVARTTTAAPENLELSSGGGAIFIRALDANGRGVPQANVHIVNQKLMPNLIIDDLTNNDGILQLVDIPQSVGGYNIIVTKPGYSGDQTYPPGGSENPNPVKADSTVRSGEVTQATFAIDRVSSLSLRTTNQVCSAVSDVGFHIEGSKLIGTNPDILKYSLDTSTDAAGQRFLNNLEWDTYRLTLTDPDYDLAGSIPALSIDLAPATSQTVLLLANVTNPRSLLVTVKEASSGLPVTGATVTVSDGSSLSAVSGRGSLSQTDWSGGPGQADLVDPTRYFSSDGNVDDGPPDGELTLLKIGPSYVNAGWLESSTFDTGSPSDFHNISWQPTDQPPATGPDAVKFQVASNNDNATWGFVGPDGTAASFYTLANTNLANHNGRRYLRYRVFLQTLDSSRTPNISDIAFTFTSACIPPGQVFFQGLAGGTYTLTVTHPNYQTWSDDEVKLSAAETSREVLLNP